MQVRLDSAQDALHAGAQDRRVREVQGAFDQADQEYRVCMAKAAITASLLSRSPGKNWMDRLKARKTPLHRTGLTRSPSRAVNRAPGAHGAARPVECRKGNRGHRQWCAASLHSDAAPRQNAAVPERVCREGRPRPPPEYGLSSGVGHEGAQ